MITVLVVLIFMAAIAGFFMGAMCRISSKQSEIDEHE